MRGAILDDTTVLDNCWRDANTHWPESFDRSRLDEMLERSEVMSDADDEVIDLDELVSDVLSLGKRED